jgi:hypothetical protein
MIVRCWLLLFVLAVVYCTHLRTKELQHSVSIVKLRPTSQYASSDGDNQSAVISFGPRCGTKDLSEHEMYINAQRLASVLLKDVSSLQAKSNTDVYIHVIQSSTGDGFVADTDIGSQMTVLNAAYGPGGFRFVLKGVTRVESDEWFQIQPCSDGERAMKSAIRIGGAATLNVFITTSTQNVLGWATYPSREAFAPGLDGVVIDYRTLPNGSMEPHNQGGTLVHQVGHWLGLQHTFQGGCERFTAQGDGVSDTPASAQPTVGCPAPTSIIDSCPGHEGQLKGNDLVHNYMDLADDACRSQFTPGQQLRMRQSWVAYRQGR